MTERPALLGVVWGGLAAIAVVTAGARRMVRGRARSLVPDPAPRTRPRVPAWASAFGARTLERPPLASVVRVVGGVRTVRRARRTEAGLAGELAVVADLLAVAMGAGATPWVALTDTAAWMPPGVGRHLDGLRRSVRLGVGLGAALARLGQQVPALGPLADALRAGVELGAPAAPTLVRIGADARAELRRRAEARARVLPVKLLFPLVCCVLPAFGLLTVVPAVVAGFAGVAG